MNRYIIVVSNITLSPDFEVDLKAEMGKLAVRSEVSRLEPAEIEGSHEQIRRADIILVVLNLERFWSDHMEMEEWHQEKPNGLLHATLDYFFRIYKKLRAISDRYIIWYGFENYFEPLSGVFGNRLHEMQFVVEEINRRLCGEFDEQDIYIDMQKLIAAVGIDRAYDFAGKYRWNKPYRQEVIKEIIDEACKQYQIINKMGPKCIILDCDNVLWGGILSEDTMEGIAIGKVGIGRPYWDFQNYLLQLKNRGVMLAVCSKNDEEDLHRVFNQHPEMLLKMNDFVCVAANWDNKIGNIRKIIDTLNISERHIVFVDDSRFEIEAVRKILPEVRAIQFDYSTIYSALSCFHLQYNMGTECVDKRQETYRSDVERGVLRNLCGSYEAYLDELDSKIDIHEAQCIEYMRISELTLRTNKLTNGKRYNFLELKSRMQEEGYQLFSVFLSDRYSDLGLVGAIGIDDGRLDLFSLSCRAIGRKVEEEMCGFAIQMGAAGYEFSSTLKNQEMEGLFLRMGLYNKA